MIGIIRSSVRLTSNNRLFDAFVRSLNTEYGMSRLYSTIWNVPVKSITNVTSQSVSVWNNCSRKLNSYSTNKSDVELSEFLEQEITMEQELHKTRTIPSKIDDFEVKLDGAEVSLLKITPKESITVKFNISRSVQSVNSEVDENESPDVELKSTPDFDIDIKRDGTTLGFNCSYVQDEEEEDMFVINEITLFTGEESEKTYCVTGEILDGCLYDLLLNFLDEKGITNEFVEKMSELSTAYEHSSYISLLRGLKKYISS